MKNRRALRNIYYVLCGILILGIAFLNYRDNEKFFEASLINIATIVIALCVSFYFTQKRTDERKQKEILLDLLKKIQAITESKEVYRFEGQSKDKILMRNRDINNKITILETVAPNYISQEDITFIRKKFDEYSELVGDHIGDILYLSKSDKELKRPIELINNKITQISLKLFS